MRSLVADLRIRVTCEDIGKKVSLSRGPGPDRWWQCYVASVSTRAPKKEGKEDEEEGAGKEEAAAEGQKNTAVDGTGCHRGS